MGHIHRRQILLTAVSIFALPLVFAQQQLKIPRIGFLSVGSAATGSPSLDGLRDGLRSHGWVEGQNIVIEYGWANTPDRLPEQAAELVRKKVDLIFAPSSTQVEAARKVTSTIPIVFATHADPVGVGHVASLARPGGNITGVSMLMTELSAKELEILKEAVPLATRIGVLWDPTTPSHPGALRAVDAAARKMSIQLTSVPVRSAQEIESAFAAMTKAHVDALLVLASPLTIIERIQIAAIALKHRLPAIFGFATNTEAGGLMSYGANNTVMNRRAADFVDRILKGAKPADLPVQQAQEFDLVINMKTAKALGLKIPQSLLLRADRVIE